MSIVKSLITSLVITGVCLADSASAGVVSEIRGGVAAHSIDINGGDPSPENGVNLSGEVLFKSPKIFRYLLSPRPYVHGSLNLEGDTSFYGGGLAWEHHVFHDRIVGEFDFGIDRHDGILDLPPVGDPLRETIRTERVLLGSRYLFRVGVGVGVKLDKHWRAQVFYEHLSNGDILGSSNRNQGLDNVGVRLGYRFGD